MRRRRLFRRRLFLGGLVFALLVAPAAGAAVDIRGVEDSAYPNLRLTLVSDTAVRTPPVLTENGKPAAGVEVSNLASAKAVALLVDHSQSMEGRALADAILAAGNFVDGTGGGDRLSLVSFASKAIALTPFSSERGDARDALRSVKVDSTAGTALYDAIVIAARALSQESLGGKVILLMTDGQELHSSASYDQAVAAAENAQAPIYVVAIESPAFNPEPLKKLTADTGGAYFGAKSSADLARVYQSIAAELGRTWQISYVTAARPGENVVLDAKLGAAGAARERFALARSAGASPTVASAKLPSIALSTTGTVLIGLIAGVLVLGAAVALIWARQGSWVHSRLAPHMAGQSHRRKVGARERISAAAALFRATENALGHLDVWRSLTRLLVRADAPLRTVEFIYVMVGAAFVAGLLLAVSAMSVFVILLGMLGAAALPMVWLKTKVRRRLNALDNQLPDLLSTLAASLKAGHSFKQGIQAVVDEGQEPAASEFRRVLTEAGLGRPMDEALQEMGERLGSVDLEFVITAVTIQRQVGGSLADLFDMVSDTVRQRQQFRRKVKSLTAMGRMSAFVLIGLPFFLLLVLTFMNPKYMSPLWATSVGHFLLGGMIFAMGIGSLMLHKIVSFKG